MDKSNEKFPSIKKSIEDFINDEDGNITRSRLVMIGSMIMIMTMMSGVESYARHSSHSSHGSHSSHSSTSYIRTHNNHASSHYNHSSHASHASHTSGDYSYPGYTPEPTMPSEPTTPILPVTPSQPPTPTVPVTPSEPVTPTVPVIPSEPSTPDVPVTPSEPPTPAVPVTPSEPPTPAIPVTPSEPSTPVVPVTPSEPPTPTVPVTPSEPVTPTVPVIPSEPPTPAVPITPQIPSIDNTDHILAKFDDVNDDQWYSNAIRYIVKNGIMEGMTPDEFVPDGTATRAQIATVFYRLDGTPDVYGSVPFSDVQTNNWFAQSVMYCYRNGIVKGIDENIFAPDAPITREQFVTMLYRYASEHGKNIEIKGDDMLNEYPDSSNVSNYAIPAMKWAIDQGYITGTDKGMLEPQGTATRGQLAVILTRFMGGETE